MLSYTLQKLFTSNSFKSAVDGVESTFTAKPDAVWKCNDPENTRQILYKLKTVWKGSHRFELETLCIAAAHR